MQMKERNTYSIKYQQQSICLQVNELKLNDLGEKLKMGENSEMLGSCPDLKFFQVQKNLRHVVSYFHFTVA